MCGLGCEALKFRAADVIPCHVERNAGLRKRNVCCDTNGASEPFSAEDTQPSLCCAGCPAGQVPYCSWGWYNLPTGWWYGYKCICKKCPYGYYAPLGAKQVSSGRLVSLCT